MGAHYRSLQIKTENRDAVILLAEHLAKSHKGRLLIGPQLNCWTGLYCDDSVPAEAFASNISEQLKTVALDLMVHDSDIFLYSFYRDGRLIDQYSSRPDYFEEVPLAEHQRLTGKAEVFSDLLGSGEKFSELQSLLASNGKEEFVFEENRLEKFADLFGIENTLTSYEYLMAGEWEGINGRKHFVHIPDLSAEESEAKAAVAALRAEIKRLRKEGILCLESLPPGKAAHAVGEAVFDPISGGILLKWGSYAVIPTEPRLFHAEPPWTSEPKAIELPAASNSPNDLVFSGTGRWFAYSDDQLRLWDWPERRLIEGFSISSSPVQFSSDENLLLCKSRQGFEIISVETKDILKTVATGNPSPHFLAWHPAGRFMVTRHRQDQLGLVDLDAGKLIKVLYSGTINDWSGLAAVFSGSLKQAGISEDQVSEMRQGFIKGSDEPFSLKFSPDGRLLFCATTRGLRVLEWDKVLAAEKSTPVPLVSASAMPLESPMKPVEERDYINYVYDVVFDERQNRLLFAGIEGVVRFFNLNDGGTGILLKPPGNNYIWRLQLSSDREFICCFCTPPHGDRNKKPNRIQIWNYRLLRNAAGLD
jgi:hypothetical protein